MSYRQQPAFYQEGHPDALLPAPNPIEHVDAEPAVATATQVMVRMLTPLVPRATPVGMRRALREAGAEFCMRTLAWRHTVTMTITAENTEVPFAFPLGPAMTLPDGSLATEETGLVIHDEPSPGVGPGALNDAADAAPLRQAVVLKVDSVTLGGADLAVGGTGKPRFESFDYRTFRVVPPSSGDLRMTLTLAPAPTYMLPNIPGLEWDDFLPHSLVGRFGRDIVNGAAAHLMSQPGTESFDAQGAAKHAGLFQDAMERNFDAGARRGPMRRKLRAKPGWP
jgi:hypothetical protein